MRRRKRFGRWSFPLLLAGLLGAGMSALGAQEIDAHGVKTGIAASSSPRLERMILLLQPSAKQASDLDTLLAAQQTAGNASYHQWLTAAQFANRFALSSSDADKVAAWLRGQGFTVAALPAGRGWIEFSGTVSQVESAFGARIEAAGQIRYQMQGTAAFPPAIAPMVKGLVSLDGVLSEPAVTVPVESGEQVEALAAESSLSHAHALTPSLARGWLHLAAQAGEKTGESANGAGESIAIPVRSNVRAEDFAAFRKSFGLPESTLSIHTVGSDPGRTGDEAAAMLAASWAGVAAPGAEIVLVPAASTNATDGVDLALAAIVDGALAHTISVGYTACESSLSTAHQAFYAALYRQAAAEGIAVIAATGDSGPAACHSPLDTNPVASGWSVNGLASTPWNTALSAAAFAGDASSLTGWQPAGATDIAYASGGGVSALYATPQWQAAKGVPASDPLGSLAGSSTTAHHRYLPDVSLPAAAVSSGTVNGLAFCFAGDSAANGCRLVNAGGSGAAAAIFSGIAALLAEKYGPQGNLAPTLYKLAQRDASAKPQSFVDIDSGAAKLRCVLGSQGCVDAGDGAGWERTGKIGFDAAEGFDLATGLGSVNAQALVTNWAVANATGTAAVTVEETNTTGVTYNPSATITLTAKVLSGSGGTVPTGTVQFYDATVRANAGSAVTISSTGTASYTETGQFTVGGHNIEAIYSGDSTYEAATSQPVVITIEPSTTTLTVIPSTTTPAAGASFTVTGTVTSTNEGATAPSGKITVNLDGISQGAATLSTSSSGVTSGSLTITAPTSGSHAVQGVYSGDTNYDQATSSPVTITVAKGSTATSIAATPSTLTAGVPETFSATIAPSTSTTTPYTITGTVSFYDAGTTLLGTATISSNTAILTGILLSTTAAHTITAVYSGDTNWGASVSSPLLLQAILLPATVTLTASTPVLSPGQSATLTATVTPVSTPLSTTEQHPTGNVFFYAGTTLIGESALSAGLGDTGVATLFVPSLPAGAYIITAQYAGDATYGPAVSNSLNLAIEDFTVSCSVNNVNIVQGQSATITCTVASLGGLAGPIQLACAEQNPPQAGALGCTFNPTVISAGSGQSTLTITTTSGNISQSRQTSEPGSQMGMSKRGPSLWPAAGGGVALMLGGLVLWPVGRRARWLRNPAGLMNFGGRMLALGLLLIGMAVAGVGCNNSSTSTSAGTPLGVHTLKITAAADVNIVTVSHYAYVTVNVTP